MPLRLLVLAGLVLTVPACVCTDSSTGGTGAGGGGGSTSKSFTYDLIEASGEWSLTASTTSGTCTTATTSSRKQLSLPKPQHNAAVFSSSPALLFADPVVSITSLPREGTITCTTGAPRACLTSPETANTFPAYLSITPEPMFGSISAPGLAFVPVLGGLTAPSLCSTAQFDVNPGWLRGKPITLAQLQSGRFVVEGQKTVPVVPAQGDLGDSDPQPVNGTMTVSFRLVFQTADYDPANAVASPELTTYDECLLDLDSTGDEILAARDAFEAGATDIPINASGCRRLKVARTADSLTVTHELTRGTRFIFDPTTGLTRTERDTVVLYLSTIDSTGIHERDDFDFDGVLENTTETTFADGGQWLATVSSQTGLDPQTITRAAVDATTMSVRELHGSTVVEDFIAPTLQKGCFGPNDPQAAECKPAAGPPPVCTGIAAGPCGKTKSDELLKALKDATTKGKKCLAKTGKGFDPSAKAVAMMTAGRLNFICSNDPCDDLGSFQTKPNDDKKKSHDFMVNLARNTSPAELARTLFHETLHSDPRFTHNTDLDKAASNACKLQIVDRTFACETMCFNPGAANKCTCMRCLSDQRHKVEDKVCQKCDAFGSCASRRENSMQVSSAIGAWCERGKVFCDTKTECDTRCAGLGSCNQIKATCDAGCN